MGLRSRSRPIPIVADPRLAHAASACASAMLGARYACRDRDVGDPLGWIDKLESGSRLLGVFERRPDALDRTAHLVALTCSLTSPLSTFNVPSSRSSLGSTPGRPTQKAQTRRVPSGSASGAKNSKTTLLSAAADSYLAGMPARRRSASARVAPAQPGLRLHAEGERYSTLLKERGALAPQHRHEEEKTRTRADRI